MKRERWIFAVVVLIPVLFIASYLVQGKFIFGTDTSYHLYLIKRWFWTQVASGEWPLWNEYLFAGQYQFGAPTNEFFSPFSTPFYFIFSDYWAMQATLTVSLIAASLGAFLLARRFTDALELALTFSIAYTFSGPMLSVLDRASCVTSMALYPWIALAVIRLIEKPTLGRAAIWGALVSLLVHHADWLGAMVAIVLSMYFVITAKREVRGSGFLVLLLGIIIFYLLSAIIMKPVGANLPYTDRANGFEYQFMADWSFDLTRLVQQFIPEIWGHPYDMSFWGKKVAGDSIRTYRFWFHSIFVSLPLLYFAWIGIISGFKQKRNQWVFLFALVVLLISFGAAFPLHRWLYDLSSSFQKFRYPEKFALVPIVVLMGYALVGISVVKKWQPHKLYLFWAGLAVAHVVAPFVLVLLAPRGLLFEGPGNIVAATDRARWMHYGIALFAGLVAYLYKKHAQNSSRLTAVALQFALPTVVLFELMAFSPHQSKHVISKYHGDKVEFLKNPEFKDATGRWLHQTEFQDFGVEKNAFQIDWGVLSGVAIFPGYESIAAARSPNFPLNEIYLFLDNWAETVNLQYLMTNVKPRDPRLKRFANRGLLEAVYAAPDLNFAVVKINRKPHEFSFAVRTKWVDDDKASHKAAIEEGLRPSEIVLESKGATMATHSLSEDEKRKWQAWPLNGAHLGLQRGPLTVVDEANIKLIGKNANRREVMIDAPTDGWFVVHNQFHGDWQAKVNGQLAPVFRADYYVAAVPIAAGKSKIELDFVPASWLMGLRLSSIGLVLFAMIMLIPRFRNFSPQGRSV